MVRTPIAASIESLGRSEVTIASAFASASSLVMSNYCPVRAFVAVVGENVCPSSGK